MLKAEAALRYAQILVDAGVERYRDVEGLFDDEPRMAAVTEALRAVPGNGRRTSGWATCGCCSATTR